MDYRVASRPSKRRFPLAKWGCAVRPARAGGVLFLSLASACTASRPLFPPVPSVAQAPIDCQPSSPPGPVTGALKQLDKVSIAAYHDAANANLRQLPCRAPVIVNDFLNMTLYLCDGPQSPSFAMDTKRYFLMARSAHPTLAIYSYIAKQGFGPLSAESVQRLREYAALLPPAREEARARPDIDEPTRNRGLRLFDEALAYIDVISESQRADESGFQAYAHQVRPLIEANLRVGAEEQLRQFRAQLEAWRAKYPDERWDDLRVVVMGFHQARDLYATKQLFEWLLQEPAFENRVVYAEFQFSPFGDNSGKARCLALELLSKVDLDHRAASMIFADGTVLQRDVMGPSARDILKEWGTPRWAKE